MFRNLFTVNRIVHMKTLLNDLLGNLNEVIRSKMKEQKYYVVAFVYIEFIRASVDKVPKMFLSRRSKKSYLLNTQPILRKDLMLKSHNVKVTHKLKPLQIQNVVYLSIELENNPLICLKKYFHM